SHHAGDQERAGRSTLLRSRRARARCGCTTRHGCLTWRSTIMNDEQPNTIQQLTGQVRSIFYLVDEPTTTLTIQADGHMITVRATGQVALDLRALPRGATICATIHDASPYDPQIIAFILIPS